MNTMTPAGALSAAQSVRNQAIRDYQRGYLSPYACGLYQGELTVMAIYFAIPKWQMQGIENEVDYVCKLAREADQ